MKNNRMLKIITSSLMVMMILFSGFCQCPVSANTGHSSIMLEPNLLKSSVSEDELNSILGSYCNVSTLKASVLSNIKNCENIDLSGFSIPYTSDTSKALSALVWNEFPEAFNVSVTDSISFSLSGKNIVNKIAVIYSMTVSEYNTALSECDDVSDFLLRNLQDSSLSQAEKALVVHDRLACWAEYDFDTPQTSDSYTMSKVLLHNTGVCAGYAKAYKYLLAKIGISSYITTSDTLNHAWNVVIIDGEKYHVDVTWDDKTPDDYGRVYHDYFLRSTAGLKDANHDADDYDQTPVSTVYDNYYWQNSATAFQYADGKLYYIDSVAGTLCAKSSTSTEIITTITDKWSSGGATYSRTLSNGQKSSNFSCLEEYGGYIYYSGAKSIYRVDASGTKPVYTLSDTSVNIVGFRIYDNEIYVDTGIAGPRDRSEYGITADLCSHANTYVSEAKAATCTEAGTDGETICSDCGKVISKGNVIPATGHSWGEPELVWTSTGVCVAKFTCINDSSHTKTQACKVTFTGTPATCTVSGTGTYTASFTYSGKTYTDTQENVMVDPLGHSFSGYVYDNNATLRADGTKTATCSRCGLKKTVTAKGTMLKTTVTLSNMSKYNGKTLDYKSSVTFTAEVTNSAGGKVTWYVNGKKAGTGDTYTVSQATSDYTIYCETTDINGAAVRSETETIHISSSFIARIIAFFRGLFGSLPAYKQ